MDIDRIDIIAGHPALDFVNTVEGRGGDALVDYLPDIEHLLRWSLRVGLITEAEREALGREAARHPASARATWARAQELRESLNAVFRAAAGGRKPPEGPMAVLNMRLAEAFEHRRLEALDERGFAWRWGPPMSDLGRPLWQIALAAGRLLTDEGAGGRIKVCANGPCDWLFLDTSRNRGRRWCRMNVCGNVTKVRRFRAKGQGAE